jgi:sulfur-carrier protein
MTIVTLRYWAAAKDAAGAAEEKAEALTLADALEAVGDKNARLRLVLSRSSFLINGEPAGTRPPESIVLANDAIIEVLPPFAGG